MPMIRIHLSQPLRAAIDSAARASGLSRSEWVRAGLDAAAGIASLPDGFRGAGAPDSACAEVFRATSITLRATDEQAQRYHRAALLAWAPSTSEWAQMMLAELAGVSELSAQIRSLVSPIAVNPDDV